MWRAQRPRDLEFGIFSPVRPVRETAPPAGLEPAIFGLEVRRLVHKAKGAMNDAQV